MAILRMQVAKYYVMPESLISVKNAEASTCGLIIKHICNTCQEKPGWVSKEVNYQ